MKNAGAPAISMGKTLGESNIDLMQGITEDNKTGKLLTKSISGYPFGMGNCYGFVALFLGVKVPQGQPARNLVGAWLKEEPFAPPNSGLEKPGFYPDDKKTFPEVGLMGNYVPEGGLEKLLIGGKKPVKEPTFGAVAIFRREEDPKGNRACGGSYWGAPRMVRSISCKN